MTASAYYWPVVALLILFALVLWACLRRMNALDRREAGRYADRRQSGSNYPPPDGPRPAPPPSPPPARPIRLEVVLVDRRAEQRSVWP